MEKTENSQRINWSCRSGVLSILFVLLIGLSGCASQRYLPRGATFDERFVGVWTGELPIRNSENLRRWKKKRKPDGAMIINISVYDKDMKYLGRDLLSGFWWVEDNVYYEKMPSLDDLVMAYTFDVLDDESLKFTTVINDEAQKDLAFSYTEKKVQVRK